MTRRVRFALHMRELLRTSCHRYRLERAVSWLVSLLTLSNSSLKYFPAKQIGKIHSTTALMRKKYIKENEYEFHKKSFFFLLATVF